MHNIHTYKIFQNVNISLGKKLATLKKNLTEFSNFFLQCYVLLFCFVLFFVGFKFKNYRSLGLERGETLHRQHPLLLTQPVLRLCCPRVAAGRHDI